MMMGNASLGLERLAFFLADGPDIFIPTLVTAFASNRSTTSMPFTPLQCPSIPINPFNAGHMQKAQYFLTG